jgi:uncharacterized membrane protein
MNRKGQVIIYGLMVGLIIIVLALALAPATTNFSATAMNNSSDNSGLNCSDTTISNYDKGACVVVDLYSAYFIGALIFIGGAILISKIIFDN